MKKPLVDSPCAGYCRTPNSGMPHKLHGLQLWHALPEADEEIDPAFYHYPSDEIPKADVNGVTTRVMMGSAWGMTSISQARS